MANVYIGADKAPGGPVVRATSTTGKDVEVTVSDAIFAVGGAADRHALIAALEKIKIALQSGTVPW